MAIELIEARSEEDVPEGATDAWFWSMYLEDEEGEFDIFALPSSGVKGGDGSGHYGHTGLPGTWGGSRVTTGDTSDESVDETAPRDEITEEDEEKFIDAASNNRVEHGEYLGGGINPTMSVKYEDDGWGVWKPIHGRLHEGHAEVIASEIDDMLDLDLVPPTVYSEFEGKPGTSQMFIPAARTGRKLTRDERWSVFNNGHSDSESMALLDHIVGNEDRHLGNWMLGDNGRLFAIDNGFCSFSSGADLSDVLRSGIFLPVESRDQGRHTFSKHLVDKVVRIVGGPEEPRRGQMYEKFVKQFPEQTQYHKEWAIDQVWDRMVDLVNDEGTVTWW